MAIQMRRGLRADFDPYKMLPGEWAVSIDPSTSNQIVWMCFEPGVCKRMGTYEDFVEQVKEATADVKTEYVEEFDKILDEIKVLSSQVSDDKDTVVSIKTTIEDEYLPQIQEALLEIQEKVSEAKNSADAAAVSAENAKKSEVNAKNSETEAKTSETNAATSESNAKTSETNAATSATTATAKATDAENYASNAETSALTATNKAIEASQYAEEAAESAKQSQISADAAAVSEANAKASETSAAESAQSAKDYAEQAKAVSGEQVALNRQTLGYSKKNLLKNTAVSSTINGITFTVNDDGSVTLNGTATANPTFTIGKFTPVPNKAYIFTANSEVPGDNSTLGNNYCFIYNIDGVPAWKSDVFASDGTHVPYEFTPTTDNEITCQIYVAKGTTVENLTFYPMIRSAEITDGTYEPYVDDVDTRLKDVDAELGEIPNTYIPKKSILNSQEEIEANTSEESVAGALALKEINNNMGGLRFGVDADGNYGYYKDGADTVTPFKSGGIYHIGMTVMSIRLNVTGLKNITILSSKSATVRVTYENGSTKTVSILATKEQIIDVVGAKDFRYSTTDGTQSSVTCSIL